MALSLTSTGHVDAALLTTTTNPVFTASGADQVMILKATVNNTDASQHVVTVWRVPSGGSPATAAYDAVSQTIAANTTATLPLSGQVLVNNDQLFAKQDAGSGVNLNLSYAVLDAS